MTAIVPSGLFRGAGGCLALEANRDDFLIVSGSLDHGDAGRFDQIGEARKAIVARIEVGRLFRQMRANAAEIGATVFVGVAVTAFESISSAARSRGVFAGAGLAAAPSARRRLPLPSVRRPH